MNGCTHEQGVFGWQAVAEAVEFACLTELGVMKPGNVSVHGGGQGKTAEDFMRSARAITPELSRQGSSVGERILNAVRSTRREVDCNTNLGIVLLCAPLAHAALQLAHGQSLRQSLRTTLRGLDRRDTQRCFEAIRLARPGGLGVVQQYDVAEKEPRIGLLQAMAAAAVRDRIARQYVTDFEDVFEIAVPHLQAESERLQSCEHATMTTYLYLLGAIPDTHIQREFDRHVANSVCRKAKQLYVEYVAPQMQENRLFSRLSEFDKELKRKGINPGTTADMTVAALMVLHLQNRQEVTGSLLVNGPGSAQCADPVFF
ncbi:MAG: triphosphoribosyl-dephospho-CoA synthase [Gammaproteobacteria bacterium]|nr:MAG: triphosphoribosyl-dephospho-CoA synthase [Gammaproteobacteria bacterium]